MNCKIPFLGMLALAFLNGCGGGSSSGPQPILVVLSTPPPSSIVAGGTATVSATVSNDTAAKGVTWNCAPAGTCGSFSPMSTASGASTTYTAPASSPSGGMVTITASSVTDGTKSASATVTIPGLSVVLSTPPPSSLAAGGTATVTATVSSDTAAKGVTWSCAPAGTCGSFNPTSTASGVSTTYTAPASPPSGGKVTITASSVADSTKSASATVIIPGTASKATLKGQYVFFITAPTGNRKAPAGTWGTTTFVGSVTVDGAGNITGGVDDMVSPAFSDTADPILATTPNLIPNTSYYTVDPSGHGTMRIKTANNETLDFSFVLTSASHALIIEADGNPGSGTLDLQQPTATGFAATQISGGYSFTMTGPNSPNPATKVSLGGVFTANGALGLSNATLDVNTAGVMTNFPPTTQSFTAPDTNGRGRLFMPGGRLFTYYIISAKALRMLEGDNIDLTGGSAYAQSATVPPLSGKFVFQHSGWSSAGRTIAVGQFTANGSGSITAGVSDSIAGGPPTTPSTSKPVTGSYMLSGTQNGTLTLMDAAGSSNFNIYMVDPAVNILDPNNSSGGGGALLLHTDATINGTGIVVPQAVSATPSFVANYALNLTNSITTSTTTDESDLVGVVSSDGSSKFVNGLADYDKNDSANPAILPVLGVSFTGTFAADNTNSGRFTGSFTVTPGAYPFISATAFNVSFYQASGSQAFVIQTDLSANVSGYLLQQQLP